MMYNPWIFPMIPMIPRMNEMPPTLYTLLNSIVNFGKDEKTKIRNLAKEGRAKIFDFDYPLTNKVSRETFECMILNHFLERRIGSETFTSFQIKLEVKLNEIMPLYNMMFDSLEGWDLFKDGETTIRDLEDNRESHAENVLENYSSTNTNSTSDRRNSAMPQSQIDNVKDGKYLSNYNFDTDNTESSDSSNSSGTSDGTDKNILHEEIKRSVTDKINSYKELQQNVNSIYKMIFNDLESLFYQLV